MNWKQLISSKRLGKRYGRVGLRDERSEFKRDYDRLIFSAPFRRMQNKTQVFPLPGSVFVHNRLTHSLEVASVGMSLGSDVARTLTTHHPELKDSLFQEIGTVVSAACLAHDMGNPPFGHSGEKAIQTFFSEGKGAALKDKTGVKLWNDVTHFEGNANAFRLLAHRFNGRRNGGFAMTYTMLASVVKYPCESGAAGDNGKFGFFNDDKEIFKSIADELGILRLRRNDGMLAYARHPLVYLVEAADDICYEIMDIEDAFKLKILSFEATEKLFLGFFDNATRANIRKYIRNEGITDDNEKVGYMRSLVIGELENLCTAIFVENEDSILNGKFQGSLIDRIPEPQRGAYTTCKTVASRKIYHSKPVLDIELSGYRIMETLMEQMTEAVVHPDRYYSRQLINRVSSQYDILSDKLETRLLAVIDYISGMTDVYALDLYQKLSGISLPVV